MVKKLSNSCPARHDSIPAGHRLLRERDKNFNDLDKILHFQDSSAPRLENRYCLSFISFRENIYSIAGLWTCKLLPSATFVYLFMNC